MFARYAADGNRREGQWIDDQLHGFVTFTCRSCNNNNDSKSTTEENGFSEKTKRIDVTKIERWRKGRRISDGVSERSPLVNLFDRLDFFSFFRMQMSSNIQTYILSLIHNEINFQSTFSREDPKESDDKNKNNANIPGESLTPSNFSRAYFKSNSREIPINNDSQSNISSVHIFDVLKEVPVFHFSVPTPRNLVVEDAALKSRFQSARSLKRHFDYVHNE